MRSVLTSVLCAALLFIGSPAIAQNVKCDITGDGNFTITDPYSMLQQLVGVVGGVCVDSPGPATAVDLVWQGPDVAGVDFVVAYDGDGVADPCRAGENWLMSQNHDAVPGEAHLALVHLGNVSAGTVLATCDLVGSQSTDGILTTVNEAANADLAIVSGTVEVVAVP